MTFRKKIAAVFILYSLFITVVFSLLLSALPHFIEDTISQRFLVSEYNAFSDRYIEEGEDTLPIKSNQVVSYYRDAPDFPEWLGVYGVGLHEAERYHILVRPLSDGRVLYILYDESQGYLDQNEGMINGFIVLVGILVMVLATFLSRRLTERIAQPIEQLASDVSSNYDVTEDNVALSRNDELGKLAHAFLATVERIKGFVEREKDFTRYASHELRTPLTVFKNNLDLLSTENIPESIQVKARSRLSDAVNVMEQQVSVLLLLAREQTFERTVDPVDVKACVASAIDGHPQLHIEIDISSYPSLYVEPIVFRGILDNLLRNVAEHGSHDDLGVQANIVLTESYLCVSNSCSDLSGGDAHKTFGLEIVKKLCSSVGWRYYKESGSGTFTVKIDFH